MWWGLLQLKAVPGWAVLHRVGVWVVKASWLEEFEFILKTEYFLTGLLRKEGIIRRGNCMSKDWEVGNSGLIRVTELLCTGGLLGGFCFRHYCLVVVMRTHDRNSLQLESGDHVCSPRLSSYYTFIITWEGLILLPVKNKLGKDADWAGLDEVAISGPMRWSGAGSWGNLVTPARAPSVGAVPRGRGLTGCQSCRSSLQCEGSDLCSAARGPSKRFI